MSLRCPGRGSPLPLRETLLTGYTALARDAGCADPLVVLAHPRHGGGPTDLLALDAAAERQRMAHALEYRIERGDVELAWVEGGSARRCRRRWTVALACLSLHRHGGFDPATGRGCWQQCRCSGRHPADAGQGAGPALLRPAVTAAGLLNDCEGGRTSDAEQHSEASRSTTDPAGESPRTCACNLPSLTTPRWNFPALLRRATALGSSGGCGGDRRRQRCEHRRATEQRMGDAMLHMRAPDGRLLLLRSCGPSSMRSSR